MEQSEERSAGEHIWKREAVLIAQEPRDGTTVSRYSCWRNERNQTRLRQQTTPLRQTTAFLYPSSTYQGRYSN